MMLLAINPILYASAVGLALLSVAAVLCVVRLWLGPSLPDRVVALDLLATVLVGGLVVAAIATGEDYALRVATVLALVNFVGTAGFAIFLRRSEQA